MPGSRLNTRNAQSAHPYCNRQLLKKFCGSNKLRKFNATKISQSMVYCWTEGCITAARHTFHTSFVWQHGEHNCDALSTDAEPNWWQCALWIRHTLPTLHLWAFAERYIDSEVEFCNFAHLNNNAATTIHTLACNLTPQHPMHNTCIKFVPQ